jgi:hypothetical protein
MDVEALIKQAHALAQSSPLYRYDQQTLEQTIRDGVIPEGAVIAYIGNQKLVRKGNEVVFYKRGSNGVDRPNKRTQMNDAMFPLVLVQYAITKAYAASRPVAMGMF